VPLSRVEAEPFSIFVVVAEHHHVRRGLEQRAS